MTASPVGGRSARTTARGDERVAARIAVALALCVVIALAVSYAIFGVALALGGEEAVADTWIGLQAACVLFGGLVVSLVAFVSAVVARRRNERTRLLWIPLTVFPALVGLVAVAELFVIE